MIDLKNVDYQDAQRLFKFSMETVNIAEQYKESRIAYAESKRKLNQTIAEAYRDGKLETKHSVEKAVLILSKNPEISQLSANLITNEETYKGLEEVIRARMSAVSLAQSLSKLG